MSELPKGWTTAKLADLCQFNPKHSATENRNQKISFVPMPAVSDVLGIIKEHDTRRLEEVWTGYTHFQNGDVIFAKITPCMENGKIAVAQGLHNGLACGSTEFHVMRPHEGIVPEYLWRFLRQKSFRDDAERHMTGAVGQRRVPKDYLERHLIPVPPSQEQRRIVDKLDRLTSRTQVACTELDRIPALAGHYKKALFRKAFTGELTARWRAENPTTRDRERWSRRPLAEVVHIASGQTPKGIENNLDAGGDVCWFKVSSMNDPENSKLMTTSAFRLHKKTATNLGLRFFPPGTVIFPKRGGAIATNKKRRLAVSAPLDLSLMALTPKQDMHPDFLWWWIMSIDLVSLSNGSNVPQINHGDLETIEIELPPFEEQAEIARHIEKAWSWLEKVGHESGKARGLLTRLDQAMLTKAFRGKLVEQNSADEPAMALVERVRDAQVLLVRPRGRRRVTA